jgi:predicted anti-sigma-YlaC factor YlaD
MDTPTDKNTRGPIRLSCQEVSRLLSARQDGSLPLADQARLRLHLAMCQACRNVDEQMDFLRRAMRQLGREGGDQDEREAKR